MFLAENGLSYHYAHILPCMLTVAAVSRVRLTGLAIRTYVLVNLFSVFRATVPQFIVTWEMSNLA